jgi:hypothetical protein
LVTALPLSSDAKPVDSWQELVTFFCVASAEVFAALQQLKVPIPSPFF